MKNCYTNDKDIKIHVFKPGLRTCNCGEKNVPIPWELWNWNMNETRRKKQNMKSELEKVLADEA
jgi:hypothetical protein